MTTGMRQQNANILYSVSIQLGGELNITNLKVKKKKKLVISSGATATWNSNSDLIRRAADALTP